MHQRTAPVSALDQVQAVVRELEKGWMSSRDLSERLGMRMRAVRRAIVEASHHQYVFCRKGEPAWKHKQYRILPEAVRVTVR